jgi:cyclase
LNETHNIIKELIDQGFSLDAIKALDPLNRYTEKWNWHFITTERMVIVHYYDITGLLE